MSAESVDWQIAEIWRSVEFVPDWRERMAEFASRSYDGPDLAALNERRRRLARAYGDGAYGDAEYATLRGKIDQQMQSATIVQGPSYEQAVRLFADMPALWEEATADERRRLLDPLIERAYMDIDSQRIGAITPTPAFRGLLDHALQRASPSKAVLLTEVEARQFMSGYGLVETGEAPSRVTHNSCLVFPHRLQARWLARGLAWGSQAA